MDDQWDEFEKVGTAFELEVMKRFIKSGFYADKYGRRNLLPNFNKALNGQPENSLMRFIKNAPDTVVISPSKSQAFFVECKGITSDNEKSDSNAINLYALKSYKLIPVEYPVIVVCHDWHVYNPRSIDIHRYPTPKPGYKPFGLFKKHSGMPFDDFIGWVSE